MSELSRSDEWRTPQRLFRALDARYGFTFDVAAAPWNAQCSRYWTKRDDALSQPWYGRCFMNPPYSKGNLAKWVPKARNEVLAGRAELVGCLLPFHAAERWWDHVEAPAPQWLNSLFVVHALGSSTILAARDLTVEITRLRGRQSFLSRRGRHTSARFPSVFVAFMHRAAQLPLPSEVWGPGPGVRTERRAA